MNFLKVCYDACSTASVLRRIHGWLTIFWLIQLVVVWFMPSDWRIPYLIIVSIYANFVGHWSSWQASRVEVNQEAENGNS